MSEAAQAELPANEQPKEPAKEEKGALTQYVVLIRDDDGRGYWAVVKAVQEARSAKAAITAYLADAANKDGTYIAVPIRSWDPITVKTETTTKLVFS